MATRRACEQDLLSHAPRVIIATMTDSLHAERVINHLHAQMRSHRVSQATVASALGISQAAVSRRLLREVPMSLDEFETIAAVLGANPVILYAAAAGDS